MWRRVELMEIFSRSHSRPFPADRQAESVTPRVSHPVNACRMTKLIKRWVRRVHVPAGKLKRVTARTMRGCIDLVVTGRGRVIVGAELDVRRITVVGRARVTLH